MSNVPSKPVSFSRPKVGYFSNRPRISGSTAKHTNILAAAATDPKIISDSPKSYSSSSLNTCFCVFFYCLQWDLLFENCLFFLNCFGTGASGIVCFIL